MINRIFVLLLLQLTFTITCINGQDIPLLEDGSEPDVADPPVALVPVIRQSRESENILEVLNSESMVTIDIGQHLRVVEGVSVTIRCDASGMPRPRIIWELNRKRIRDNLILQTTDSLVIIKFQKHHSGYYTCIAQNINGQATAYSNIHENLAPPSILSNEGDYMVTEPKNITITVGDRLSAIKGMMVTIKCPFIGFPYPRATWFHNDQVIDHAKVANLDITEPDGVSLLTIRSFDEEYGGTYMCSVFNVYGRMSKSAFVRLITPWQPTIFSKRQEEKYDSFQHFANISIGSNLTVFDETDVNIYCDVRSAGNSTTYPITWTRKVESAILRDLLPGRNLIIRNIKKEDAGVYKCVVNDGIVNGDEMTSTIEVIHKIAPTIQAGNRSVRYVKGWSAALVVIGEHLLVRAGLDVKLSCPFKAFPEGELLWQRNGVTLSLPETTLNMKSSGDTLTIRDIKESDEDTYTCIVKSKIGQTSASSIFNVIPQNSRVPRIPKSLTGSKDVFNQDSMVTVDVGTSIKIVEGAAVTITCRATGIPKPTITWELNQKPVQDEYILQTDDSLVFVKFHSYHSGYYKCQAENVMGKTRAFSDVRTQAPTELRIMSSSGSFQITEESSVVKITIGETIKTTGGRNITIYCPTEGTPKPKVLWKYNGKMIELGKRIHIDRENAITIPDVKQWDSGVYACFAGNSFEVVSSKSHLEILPEGSPVIIVNKKVKQIISGPNLVDVEIGTNLTTITGKSLRILCPAVGGSKLFYDWTIDGKPLHYDTRMSLQIPNQLIIRDLQFFDNGQFTCRVYNEFGSDSMSSLLTLIDDGSVVGSNKKTSPGAEPRKRITIGTNIVMTKGKSVELICPTRGGKRPQLSWMKDNAPIVPSNYIVPRGEVLLLQYVQPNMNGYYSCTLTTEFGSSVATSHVKINDLVPVKILKRSGRQQAFNPSEHIRTTIGINVYAVQGVAITLQCPHMSSPPAKISWYFNGTKINENDEDYVFSKEAIIIPKMEKTYSGKYTCEAKQPERVRSAHSRIYGLSMKKPAISCSAGKLYTRPSQNNIRHISIGDDIIANMHKNIFIHCPPLVGIPKPQVVWKLNGKPIRQVVGLHDWKNGSIELMSVVWEHTGTFECHQINPVGMDSCSTDVKVYGKNTPTIFQVESKEIQIKGSMQKTYSVKIGDIVTVREGTTLSIKCPVNMYGPVDIAWTKDGKKVNMVRRKEGAITFRKIRVEDSGEFDCISNDQAAVKFGTVKLNVIVSLQNLLLKPKSTPQTDDVATLRKNIEMNVGKNVTVFVGSTIKFLCDFRSDKDVDVTWLKDGLEIAVDQPGYAKDLNYLYVRDTKEPDTFKITCVVHGVLDNAQISSFVEVQGKILVKINSEQGTVRASDPNKQLSTIIGKHVFAVSGMTIRITCPHVGYPAPEIKWMLNRTLIVNNSSFAFDGDALVIPKMIPTAAGTYTCIAKQEDYKTSAVTRVIYQAMQKPEIAKSNRKLFSMITSDDPISMIIGDSLRSNLYKKVYIVCPVKALPKASVIWKFKGKPVAQVKNSEVFSNGTLLLYSVLWEHQGTFECFQANPVGIDSAYSDISVVGKYTPTRFNAQMNTSDIYKMRGDTGSASIGSGVLIKEGSTLQLKCPVGRFGPVYVDWKKAEGGFQRTGDSKDGSYLMSNIKISDSGTYVCISSDPAKVIFGSIKVTVMKLIKKLIVHPPNPSFDYIVGPFKEVNVVIGSDVRVLSGNSLKFTCPVTETKDDELKMTWLVNDKEILPNNKVDIQGDTFLIRETSRPALFRVTCVVTGILDEAKVDSSVEIIGLVPVEILSAQGAVNATDSSTKVVATIGQTIRAMQGVTIEIRCPHISQPKGRVLWYANKTVINNSTKYLYDRTSNSIVIPKMMADYGGVYTCMVNGVKSKAKSTSYVILLSTRKPNIIKSHRRIATMPTSEDTVYLAVGDTLVSNIGKRIMIDCPITGLPSAHIDWKFNRKPISPELDTRIMKNGTLYIRGLTWKHKGQYICFQTNPAGLDWASSEVNVYGRYTPTSFQVQKQSKTILDLSATTIKAPIGTDITIAEKNSLVIECTVETFGPVDISWVKDGKEFEKGNRKNIFLAKLKQKDSGNYSCFTADPANVLFGSVIVDVIVSPKDLIIKPKQTEARFTKYTSKQVSIDIGTNIEVLSGNVVRIKCPLYNKKDVKITWLMNAKMMYEDPMYTQQGDVLVIKETNLPGIFYYSCLAESTLGKAKMTSKVEVIALRKPKITKSKEILYTDPRGQLKYHLNIGDFIVANLLKVITMHCEATGVPKPNIVWKFNGRPISEIDNLIDVNNGSMIINRVRWDNQGVYECYQINSAGLDTAFSKVKVYGRYTPTQFKVSTKKLNFMDISAGRDATAPIGSNVTIGERMTVNLQCQVTRYGTLDVTWTKDGKRLEGVGTDRRGNTVLTDVRVKDSGLYECYSSDKARVKFGAIDLKVLVPLEQLIIRPSAKTVEHLELSKRRVTVDVDVGTSVQILANNDLRFVCHLKSDSNVKVVWLKDGNIIEKKSGYSIDYNKLTIRDTSKAELYTITCVVSRPTVQSNIAKISSNVRIVGSKTVEIRSKFGTLRATDTQKSLKAVIGNIVYALPGIPIEIQCPHFAVPAAKISWHFKGRNLKGNPYYMIGKVNDALFIPKMAPVFAGKYSCVAEQGKQKVTADSIVQLADMEKPIILKSVRKRFTVPTFTGVNHMTVGENMIANLNQDIMIHCPVSGLPAPKVYWKFNNQPVKTLRSNIELLPNSSIAIRNILWKNQGVYECSASNLAGLDTVVSKIMVVGRYSPANLQLKKQELKILDLVRNQKIIVSIGSSVTIRESNSLFLNCPVYTYGSVPIQWEKDGKIFSGNLLPMGTILLRNLSPEDSGDYVCYSNDRGKFKFGGVSVRVVEHVHDILSKLKIAKKAADGKKQLQSVVGKNVTIFAGSTFKLTCPVKSSKSIKIQWQLNGREIRKSNKRFLIDDSVMIILDTARKTSYSISCVITGILGNAKITSHLNIVDFERVAIQSASKLIRVTSPSKNARATIGNTINAIPGITVQIRCPHTGFPKPDITWLFNGEVITEKFSLPLGLIGNALVIPRMSKNYIGVYTCHLTQKDDIREAESSVNLLSMKKPKIRVSNNVLYTNNHRRAATIIGIGDTLTVNLKKKISIACPTSGIPDPKKMWKLNGNPIDKIEGLATNADGDIIIESVRWKHNGTYECNALNYAGADIASSKVTVVGEKTPTQYSPPTATVRVLRLLRRPYSVNIGTNVTIRAENTMFLNCPVAQNRKLKYFWMKGEKPFYRSNEDVNRKLVLRGIKNTDSGQYICVSNDPARVKFGTVSIDVIEPLEDIFVETTGPPVTSNVIKRAGEVVADIGVHVQAISGSVVKLKCNFKDIDEKVTVGWTRNGRKITPYTAGHTAAGTELTIKDTQRPGNRTYSCLLTGLLGKAEKSSLVEIIEYVPVKINGENKRVKFHDLSQIKSAIIGSEVYTIPGISFRLKCPYVGMPKPTIGWFFNRTEIQKKVKVGMVNDDIIIPKMSREYVGTYTCVALQGTRKVFKSSMVKMMLMMKPYIVPFNKTVYSHPKERTSVHLNAGGTARVNLYKTLMIHCGGGGVPPPKNVWKFNGNPIRASDDIIETKNGSLLINPVTWGHKGTYECFKINPAGLESATSKVIVYGRSAPTHQQTGKKTIRVLGFGQKASASIGTTVIIRATNSLLLKCPVQNFGSVQVTWMKDGKKIVNTGRIKHILDIEGIDARHAGEYDCISNDEGKVKFGTIRVKVLEPMNDLIIRPETKYVSFSDDSDSDAEASIGTNVAIVTGNPIRFRCLLKYTDNVNVTWFVDRKNVKSDKRYIIDDNILYVKGSRNMRGTFNVTCRASSLLGSKQMSSMLKIADYVPVKVIAQMGGVRQFSNPSVTALASVGTNIQAIPGISIRLRCPYEGRPKPTIEWYSNKTKIRETEKFSFVNDNTELIIPKMSREYVSKYTCVASQGKVKSTGASIIRLLLMTKPQIFASNNTLNSVPTPDRIVFMNIGDRLRINLYKRLMIHCGSNGIPTPKTVWKFNGKPIDTVENIIEGKNGSLLITSITWNHEGTYECFRINPAGLDTATSKLKVYGQYSPTNFVPKKGLIKLLEVRREPVPAPIGSTVLIRAQNSLVLKCPVGYYGSVKTAWYKDGKIVQSISPFVDGYTMDRISSEDSGIYVCRSDDRAKIKFGEVSIKVLEPVHSQIIRPEKKLITFPEQQDTPIDITVGTDVTAITGNKLDFKCMIKDSDNLKIMWLINGSRVTGQGENTIRDNVLEFRKVTRGGIYKVACKVTSMLGEAEISSKVQIVDFIPAKVTVSIGTVRFPDPSASAKVPIGKNVFAVNGLSLKITCNYVGLPKPQISWYFNRSKIERNEKFPVGKNTDDLIIPKMSRRYEGMYSCIALQGTRKTYGTSVVKVLVMQKPRIFKTSQKVYGEPMQDDRLRVNIGDTVTVNLFKKLEVNCESSGVPKPKTVWKFNGKPISGIENVLESKNGTLMITSITWMHRGSIECFKMNPAGLDTASSKVNVYGQYTPTNNIITNKTVTILKPRKDAIISPIGTKLIIRAMNSVILTCPVLYYGKVDIMWFKNGVIIKDDRQFNDMLRIAKLSSKDSGDYVCYSSDVAKVKFGTVTLNVIEPVKDLIIRPQTQSITFSQNSKEEREAAVGTDVSLITGNKVRLRCLLKSHDNIKITWLVNGKEIMNTRDYEINDNVLHVKNTFIGGKHNITCRVSSLLGSTQISSKLNIVDYIPVKILGQLGVLTFVNPAVMAKAVIGTNIMAIPGISIKLGCPYSGRPKPDITWYVNDTKIDRYEKYPVGKGSNDMIIPKMTQEYVGKYTCVASQGKKKSSGSSTIKLLVMSTPIIMPSNKTHHSNPNSRHSTVINIGDSLTINMYKRLIIHCRSKGLPTPKTVWKFNGKSISEVENVFEATNGSLMITPITWAHNGVFECYKINPAGLDSARSEVKVYGKHSPTNFQPIRKSYRVLRITRKVIVLPLGTKLTVRSHNSIVLKCPVREYGNVLTAWYKNGLVVKSTQKFDEMLKLTKINGSDSGRYTCVSQDIAKVEFGAIVLKVLEPIKDLIIRPQLKSIVFLKSLNTQSEAAVGTNVKLVMGNEVRLRCLMKSQKHVNITWSVNDQKIANDDVRFEKDANVLLVRNTMEGGTYTITCQVSSLLGSEEISSKLEVVVPTKLNMHAIQQNLVSSRLQDEFKVGGRVQVRHGSSIDVQCPVTAIPPPTIMWYFEGRRLEKVNKKLQYNFRDDNLVLTISFAEQRHSGIYKCVATGLDGESVEASMDIYVYEPQGAVISVQGNQEDKFGGILGRNSIYLPSSSSSPVVWIEANKGDTITEEVGQDYKLLSGLQLNLTCPSKGRPKPSIIWKKDGHNIASGLDHFLIDTQKSNSSGIYSCTAYNVFGTVTKSSSVDAIVPSKPIIQREPVMSNKTEYVAHMDGATKVEVFIGDNLETISGTAVSIRCPAIGVPRPKITYYKDGKLIKPSLRIKIDALGSLLLSPATIGNSSNGVYTCRAQNEAGIEELHTKLDLYSPLKPEFLPPKRGVLYDYNPRTKQGKLVLSVGQNAIAYPNTQVVIKCPVAGFPFPVIIWEKDDKILMESPAGVSKADATNLKYKLKAGGGGEFFCTATNMAGSVRKKATIEIRAPSAAKIDSTKANIINGNTMSETITVGSNANLLVNSSLKIYCPTSGEPEPKMRWSKDGKPFSWLQKHKYVSVSKTGHQLNIKKLTGELKGVYTCTATNIFGKDLRRSSIAVKDIFPPRITNSTKKVVAQRDVQEVTSLVGGDLFVRPNTRVLIQCLVSGSPPPSVKWIKDGKELNLDIDKDTKTLTLPGVGLKHEGTYTCIAKNFLSTVSSSTKLYIGMRPTIPHVQPILSPIVSTAAYSEVTIPIGVQEAFVRSGSTASFQCNGKGYPRPVISWFRNGVGIDYNKGYKKYQSLIPSVLEVKKLSPEDAGMYSCMVNNVFGNTIKRTKLEILEPPVIQKTKSNITFNPSTDHVRISVGGGIIVLKGASVSLNCPTTGKPKPQIHWSKRNTTFFVDRRFSLTPDKQLTIKNIQTSDSGKYICTARNKVASASSFVRLLVADKPNAVILPNYRGKGRGKSAGVLDTKGRLIVPSGSPIRLFCKISGSPTPRITWLKDHTIVRASEKYQVSKGLLEVNLANSTDAGTYVCMVENLLGVTTVPIEVLIGAAPQISQIHFMRKSNKGSLIEASVGTEINVFSDATVKIYCNATGIPKPIITWERDDGEDGSGVIRSQTSESGVLTLSNIAPETAGNITCVAKNVIGMDKVASVVSIIDPPKIISDVKVSSLGDERYMLMGRDEEVNIIEGESLKLVCVSQGSPYPNIYFSHPRQKLSGEEMFDMLQNLEGNSAGTVEEVLFSHTRQLKQTLKFQQVTRYGTRLIAMVAIATIKNIKLIHKGVYSCKAKNNAGADEKKIKFIVHPKPKLPHTGTWVVSNYGMCGPPCVRVDYGEQQRNVSCLTYGGKITHGAFCGAHLKPKENRECPTMQCTTMWKTGMWSECSATCGDDGVQERIPYCIYSKWKQQTDSKNCENLKKKPETVRKCNQYPCSEDKCIDTYQYCKFMKKMGFCRMQKYKTLCCASCIGGNMVGS